jgi:hypothetical protein
MLAKQENQIFGKFIGTWKLVECIETDQQGNIRYPWGKDAIGYIIYTIERIMAVQIMRTQRGPFLPSASAQMLLDDYNAYFGTFEIDEKNSTVIHHVQGHLNPSMVGKKNIREYQFEHDKLHLTTVGNGPTKKLTWQKITK